MIVPATSRLAFSHRQFVTLVALAALVACGGFFAWKSHSEDQEKKRLRWMYFHCVYLHGAIDSYVKSEANSKHELPNALYDLIQPPFGGSPFLDEQDLIDAWGKPVQMERAKKSNGEKYIIVKTTAPDGTPISQYGLGPGATPRPE